MNIKLEILYWDGQIGTWKTTYFKNKLEFGLYGWSKANVLRKHPFYSYGLSLIPVWVGNYIHSKVWDEITYRFPNFNGAIVAIV